MMFVVFNESITKNDFNWKSAVRIGILKGALSAV